MDDYSAEKVIHGLVVSGNGSGLVLRDNVSNRDRNTRNCSRSRLNCSARINSMKSSQIGSSVKAKSISPSAHTSSSKKEPVRISSRTCPSSTTNLKKPSNKIMRKLESSSQNGSEVSESLTPLGKIRREPTSMEVGRSSIASSARHQTYSQRTRIHNQDKNTSGGSFFSSRSKSSAQSTPVSTSKHSLRNLRCNPISDIVLSGCSSSNPNSNRTEYMVDKRTSDDGESSKGKKMSGSSLKNTRPVCRISVQDKERANKVGPSHLESSVRPNGSKRSISGNTSSVPFPNGGTGKKLSLDESHAMISNFPQPYLSIDRNASRRSTYSRSCDNSESSSFLRASSLSETGWTSSSVSSDGSRNSNTDGFMEVLLALERLDPNQELTYEQALSLETNTFLSGLNFYDRHRDMRLDIDHMSYEELLALEERMGTVSTAVPEETLSECLERSLFPCCLPEEDAAMIANEDNVFDVKCCICQEEYDSGDEIGRLQCEHRFHHECIREWLRMKNWCPICKTSAAVSSESSS